MHRVRRGVLLSLAGCAALVTAAVALRAQQAAPPALYVAMFDVRDAERFRVEYASKVPETLTPFGGRIVAGGGRLETVEGEPLPGRPVIIQFPSMDAARAWLASETYGAIRPARQATAGTRSFVVEGRQAAN